MSLTSTRQLRTVLVTGGCGFIGSAFAKRAVAEGHRVIVLDAMTYAADPMNLADQPDIKVVVGNITDTELVAKLLSDHRIDTVVNFAAETHVDRSISSPEDFVQTNVVGVYSLLTASLAYQQQLDEAAAERFRFVQISTDEVFGSLEATGFFTEETAYSPRSPYSASKAAADHLVMAWHHTYGLPTIITYCTNNYGAFQYPEKLIPHMVQQALLGEVLPVYGDGSNVRDWIYVEDHVRGILSAIERGAPGRTYAFGGGNERSNLELVRQICTILDRVSPRVDQVSYTEQIRFVADRLGHDFRYAIDGDRAKRELGYTPSAQFAEALELTIRWCVDRANRTSSVEGQA